jgi:hypothetical protein
MTAKRGLVAGIAVILLFTTGCVSCGNASYATAYEMGPACDIPAAQLNQVYVFAVSGMNPASILALESLREELNRPGFAKVATGQTAASPSPRSSTSIAASSQPRWIP